MPVTFIGHERHTRYLTKVFDKGTFSHAYLFSGPPHLGKFTLAKILAKAVRCEQRKESILEPCAECEGCRRVDAGSDPFLIILDEQHTLVSKKEERKGIPIEDIRELKRLFSLASPADTWKICIMRRAERMSNEAANAFLKLLEEPGERTLFILTSPHQELLLPTIVSRAQTLKFSPLPDNLMRSFLESRGLGNKEKEEIMLLSLGRPGILFRLLLEPTYALERRDQIKEMRKILQRGDAEKNINASRVYIPSAHVPDAFRYAERIAQDEETYANAIEYALYFLREELLRPPHAQKSAERIKSILDIAHQMETTNINKRLSLDVIFLEALGAMQ